MAREIEIEIPDQSDVIPSNTLKGNKHDVQKLIGKIASNIIKLHPYLDAISTS
jgi:hypothetical protein